jgi:hypothetical protein
MVRMERHGCPIILRYVRGHQFLNPHNTNNQSTEIQARSLTSLGRALSYASAKMYICMCSDI